jgi:hypothetical protein
MAVLTIDILRASREVGLSIEELSESGMVKVMDMCVSGFSPAEDQEDVSLLMSLLGVYSECVTSDMLEAQRAVSSIAPYLRSSSFFLSPLPSLANASSHLPISIPESALESLIKETVAVSRQRTPQQSIELSSSVPHPLQISISETLSHSTTIASSPQNTSSGQNNETVTESCLSIPLFVSLVGSQCGQGSDCSMKVMLQHQLRSSTLPRLVIDATSTIIQSSSSQADGSRSNLTSFEVECAPGVFANYSFDCPSGEVLTISCNGASWPLRGRQSCPVKTNSIVCQTKVQNTDVVSPSSSPSDGEVISCRLSQ